MIAYAIDDSARLCAHLMQQRDLYAPVAAGAEAHWQRRQEPLSLSMPPLRPLFSPKQFFFAEREPLFVFAGKRFEPILPTPAPQVLFGVTACDLTAIAYQDRFFAEDPYYQRRRAATLLVGVDCRRPCAGAFCDAMDAGPEVRAAHADLILHPEVNSSGCILIAATPAGEAALEGLVLDPPPRAWQARRRAGTAQARELLADASHIRAGMARVQTGDVSSETWETIGLQCVVCSGCTTVCPTCSCYATRDLPGPSPTQAAAAPNFERSRFWDSCLLEGFAREASGHHPAPSAGQRVERFWYHKLSGDFREASGGYGCVGCGRCDIVCPGVIGAHAALRRIAQA
jgi:sulfhydrogenase subunit beta (sulfur reductase)